MIDFLIKVIYSYRENSLFFIKLIIILIQKIYIFIYQFFWVIYYLGYFVYFIFSLPII